MSNKNTVRTANSLFLALVLISVCAHIFVSILAAKGINIHIVVNLLISQLIILIPGLIYLVCVSKDEISIVNYKKIRPVSVFLLFVVTWLLMPLVTAVNAFSQLFTKNAVMEISGDVLSLPLLPMLLIIGILGPFNEEFVFRGLIYNSLKTRTSRYIASAFVSALFFGLMHLNFNQFCYAFILGIAFAFIDELMDSTWPSFICHAVVNSQNVLMLYIANKIVELGTGYGLDKYYNDMSPGANAIQAGSKIVLLLMFLILLVVSLVTTALACLLMYGILALEGKEDRVKLIFSKYVKTDKEKVITISGYVAITICVFVIFLLEPVINLLK